MSALAESAYTSEQYLALERQAHYESEVSIQSPLLQAGEGSERLQSEYVNGGIFAMVGVSKEHHQIAFNLAGELHSQLSFVSV